VIAQPTLEAVKDRQRATWSSGDYTRIAAVTVPLGDVLCDAVDLRSGARVLDVATGTGHVALAAARRFCDATGVDFVPALLEVARARAEAENFDVEFRVGDAEELPFEPGSFDYVLSAIGVMFTADHARASRELTRVCRPGGTVGVLSWTPGGFVGEMLRTVAGHVALPPGVEPPTRWGTADYVSELFGEEVADNSFAQGAITVRFPSLAFFADFFLEHYGPTRNAAEALGDEGREALRTDLTELAERRSRIDGAAVSDWEYLIAIARRA